MEKQGFIGGDPDYVQNAVSAKESIALKPMIQENVNTEGPNDKPFPAILPKCSHVFRIVVICFNLISFEYGGNFNISIVFESNQTATNLVQCVLPEFIVDLTIYFPSVKEIYNADCTSLMEIPVGEKN